MTTRKPDLSHEQESILCADAANLQGLLAHANLFLETSRACHGKAITKYADNETTDFENGLYDLIQELQSAHDKIDQELERRDAVKEREHERIELSKITHGIAAE